MLAHKQFFENLMFHFMGANTECSIFKQKIKMFQPGKSSGKRISEEASTCKETDEHEEASSSTNRQLLEDKQFQNV